MTELELLVDFHKDAERQGSGSQTITFTQNIEGHNKKFSILASKVL